MTKTKAEDLSRLEAISKEIDQIQRRLVSNWAEDLVAAPPSNAKKLTKREAAHIRELKRNGFTYQAIADIYDCHRVTISRIVKGVYHK